MDILETIEKRYASLPKEIRDLLFSPELAQNIEQISQDHNLDVEKMGDVFEEIALVLVGETKSIDFSNRLLKKINVDENTLTSLVRSINERIFSPLKEILITPVKEPENITTTTENVVTKENILSEIENPTPAVHPISIADQTLPGPAKPLEITAAPAAKAPTPAQAADAVAKEFIAGKMTEPVSLPTKKYTVDPYREPIA